MGGGNQSNNLVYTKRQKVMNANRKHETTANKVTNFLQSYVYSNNSGSSDYCQSAKGMHIMERLRVKSVTNGELCSWFDKLEFCFLFFPL